jgi:hypothetical protein
VAHDHVVRARCRPLREQLAERRIARRIVGAHRAAAHLGGLLGASERELGGLDGAAEGACPHLPDRDPEGADRRADRARVVASAIDEVALGRAVVEARHPGVVLRHVGGGMAKVEDVAAAPQRVDCRLRREQPIRGGCPGGRQREQQREPAEREHGRKVSTGCRRAEAC